MGEKKQKNAWQKFQTYSPIRFFSSYFKISKDEIHTLFGIVKTWSEGPRVSRVGVLQRWDQVGSQKLHSRNLTWKPKWWALEKVTPWKKMAIFGIYVRFRGCNWCMKLKIDVAEISDGRNNFSCFSPSLVKAFVGIPKIPPMKNQAILKPTKNLHIHRGLGLVKNYAPKFRSGKDSKPKPMVKLSRKLYPATQDAGSWQMRRFRLGFP